MSKTWEGKKLILGQPISFTSYRIENGLLIERKGIFNIQENQIQLYRVVDVELRQDFIDNLVNQGTIILRSNSKYDNMTLENVGNPREVKMLINGEIAEQRRNQNIRTNEMVANNIDVDLYSEDVEEFQDNFR